MDNVVYAFADDVETDRWILPTRCRECLNRGREDDSNNTVYCTVHEHYMKREDFCSWGIRESRKFR